MSLIVIERKPDQPAQRLDSRIIIQLQFRLKMTNIRIRRLQHRKVKPFLAAKIMINHMLHRLRARRYGIHPRTVQTTLGKLLPRRGKNILARPPGVELTPSRLDDTLISLIHAARPFS